MQLRYFTAVTRLNLLQQLRNSASILILTLVPLVIIPFMEPAFKAMLLQDDIAMSLDPNRRLLLHGLKLSRMGTAHLAFLAGLLGS